MYFENLLLNLYKYVIGGEDYNNNIIRRHKKNLDKLGEFSFSPDSVAFRRDNLQAIVLTLKGNNNIEQVSELFAQESKHWDLQIAKCLRLETSIHIFLDRESSFKKVIQETLQQNSKYGSHTINFKQVICLNSKDTEQFNLSTLNLSELRLFLLKEVTLRLLEFTKSDEKNLPTTSICLCLKLDKELKEKQILCGRVLSIKGTSNCNTTAEEFYSKRTIDMRLMAEHKYGLRVTSDGKWQNFFEKLGQAAVRIELLQNKPSRTVNINLNDPTASSSKGASFILYNCARLATLFKEFDKRVASNVYPALPTLETINFNLLTQPEEWELLFLYILQFPHIVNYIKEILNGQINIHHLCSALSGLCATFSIYYRRVRVLTEPRSHLFPVLHARIYLLKAVEQVLHNGLYLLNIEPVKQM